MVVAGLPTRRRRASPLDRRNLVIAALRSSLPVDLFAEQQGMSDATLRRWLRNEIQRRLPRTTGAVTGPVERPVEILRDRWGIPHIFAKSEADAYFGFGFVAGQDRLWQLDYRRRHAHGTLAEIMGPVALQGDVVSRTLGFSRLAEQEAAQHPPRTKRLLEAFAAGVNAALAQFGESLPIEFDVLGYRPSPWRAVDSVAIARASLWQFSGRIENIVVAEAAYRYLGDLADRFLQVEAPEESIVPAGDAQLDTMMTRSTMDDGRSTIYDGRWAVGERGRRSSSIVDRPSSIVDRPASPSDPHGSNQWAIGPSLSASGAPILASDGHVPFTQPSSIYEVHLCAPGLDVIGICPTPGVPLIGNGRTRHAAWGVTNNVSSIRDLYVESLNPANPDEVLDGERYVKLESRIERVEVRGGDAIVLTVQASPRGPIVNHLIPSAQPGGDPPLALRWVGYEPHDSITWALDLARSKTADEVRQIHRGWQFSGQNPGFADVDGHIGYQMRGRIPGRGRITRGYRDPANPDDIWQAPIPFEDLPAMSDPHRGWIGSSNQRPHPPGSVLPLYGAYGDGYRSRRMTSLFESRRGYTIQDMREMQIDVYSERAASLKKPLTSLLRETSDPSLADAARRIARWNCRFGVNSVAAALFAAFWWRWIERVAAARFPRHICHAAAGQAGSIANDLLRHGDIAWFDATTSVQLEVALAMGEAIQYLAERLGPDCRRWTWGRLHPITLRHPLSAGRPIFAEMFDIGPRPCPGSQGVLNQNGFRIDDRFETTSGPHYRFLCDLADPSAAAGCNTAGNSANPTSTHYRDQFDDWLVGRVHRLEMDRQEIEVSAEGEVTIVSDLVPAGET